MTGLCHARTGMGLGEGGTPFGVENSPRFRKMESARIVARDDLAWAGRGDVRANQLVAVRARLRSGGLRVVQVMNRPGMQNGHGGTWWVVEVEGLGGEPRGFRKVRAINGGWAVGQVSRLTAITMLSRFQAARERMQVLGVTMRPPRKFARGKLTG